MIVRGREAMMTRTHSTLPYLLHIYASYSYHLQLLLAFTLLYITTTKLSLVSPLPHPCSSLTIELSFLLPLSPHPPSFPLPPPPSSPPPPPPPYTPPSPS